MTLENATFRASVISNVHYDMTFALPKGEWYFGKAVTKFDLKEVPQRPLFLDFRGIKLANLTINGSKVENG